MHKLTENTHPTLHEMVMILTKAQASNRANMVHLKLDILTFDPLICTMNYTRFIVSNQMETSIILIHLQMQRDV